MEDWLYSHQASTPQAVRQAAKDIGAVADFVRSRAGLQVDAKSDLALGAKVFATSGSDADWIVKLIDVFPGDAPDNKPNPANIRMGHYQMLIAGVVVIDATSAAGGLPLDARELGASPRHIAELIRNDGELACRYRRTFGAAPSATDDQAVLMDVGKALAAFQETFESPPTPFDRFRNALARGEPSPYPDAARRGLKTFVANCSTCHSGPNFTNGELDDNGFSKVGRPDPGRDGKFKVPTLRHLMLTAPYGHHGGHGPQGLRRILMPRRTDSRCRTPSRCSAALWGRRRGRRAVR